jgi:magnesium transporter
MDGTRFYHIPESGGLVPVDSVDECIRRQKESGFFWLSYVEPTSEELEPLIERLGFHPLSVEDALDVNQIPKLDDFENYAFLLFNAFSYTPERLWVQEVDFFLSERFLVSVDRRGPDGKPLLSGLEEVIRRGTGTDRQGPAFLMHTLLDALVDRKFTAIEALEDELSEAEEAVLARTKGFDPRSLQHVRHDLVTLRKVLFHEREVFVKICRQDCPFIPEKAIFQYRDVYDHLTRFFELTETLRDIVTSLMEIDLSLRSNEMTRASNRTNRSVRRLTFITTIFMPLSLLAGIGGMSEWSMMTGPSNWRIAYPLFLVAMAVIGLGSYIVLKWMVKRDEEKEDDL